MRRSSQSIFEFTTVVVSLMPMVSRSWISSRMFHGSESLKVDALSTLSQRCFRALTAIAMLSLSLVGMTGTVNAEQWAYKMFSETHHDFGIVSRNAKTEHAFVIENCFEEDVHIASVRSSCGCTKPIIVKNTLKSWEKSEIIAQFNTRSFIGTKSAAITVVIDRPYYAEVQLTVGGTIRSDIVVEPGEVRFGDVDYGSTKTVDLKVSYAGRRDWKITDIRGNSEFLQVKLDPATRQGNLATYLMHIRLKDNAEIGELHDELIVVTNDEGDSTFTLPVSGRVVPPVQVSPTLVSLGEVPLGQQRQQRVVVRAKKPFAITSVDCEDSRFAFTVPAGEKPVHVIPFVFTGDRSEADEGGALKRKVIIKTTLGDMTAETTVAGRVID